ncbi:MAG: hypothetical protein WDM90_02975 [Ferruginibacter sp.]
MKTTIITFLLLLSLTKTQAQREETEAAKKFGLISYLTTVKTLAEFKMLTLSSDSQYSKIQNATKIKGFNSNYNLIKLYTDLLINQLSGDLYNSNSLKGYRRINRFLKTDKPLSHRYAFYQEIIAHVDTLTPRFLFAEYGSLLSGPSLADITGVAEQGIALVTAARDFREKKIQSITALLKELKLQGLGDLIKPKDKKD